MRQFVHPDRLLKTGSETTLGVEHSDGTVSRESQSSPGSASSWEAELRKLLEDRRTPLHLVGVGNPLRGDDAVGLEIVSQLATKIGNNPVKDVIVHAPSAAPESLLSKIDCVNERILIFDAVELGGEPGQVTLANLGNSKFGYFATHNVPLRVIPGLAANPSNVYVSGIEPEKLEVGEGLSGRVRTSADVVASVVESALGGGSDGPS